MMEESPEDLAKKIVDLEAQWDRWKEEKLELEEEVMKVKREEDRVMKKYMKMKGMYMDIREKFDSEKMKLREENEKIRKKYWEAEMKKRELTIDLEAALSQQRGGDEGATESQVECLTLNSSLEDRDSKIVELLGKIKALDEQNNILERDFKDKMALKAKKTKIEEDKNSKLIQKIQALERDKEKMVAEVSKLEKEKIEEVEKSFSLKKTLEDEKKRLVEAEGENFELGKKIEALYGQKDSLERYFKDKMVMEAKKMKMEEEENSKLIQALKRDKEQMVAAVLKLHKEKSEELEKSFIVKKALEAEKKRLVEVEGENFRLAQKIEALDTQKDSVERGFKDKMIIEAKKTKMQEEENSKLIQKIQALERDKEQMVAEVLKLKKEKSEEVEKSFSVKKDLEAERKRSVEVEGENFELAKKIKTLDRQNNNLLRDLKDKVAMKAMKTKVEEEKNSKLIQKIQALERYKEEMVAEVSKLQKEKSEEASAKKALEAEKKRLTEVEGKNSELARKIVEIGNQAHLGSNVNIGIVGTSAQIQGNIKIEVQTPLSSTEHVKPLSGKLTGGRRSWERALPPPSS